MRDNCATNDRDFVFESTCILPLSTVPDSCRHPMGQAGQVAQTELSGVIADDL
jgi:hypothetical protein